MMLKEPVIEVRNLRVTSQKQVILDDINLTVRKGDFYAIIGPNGAGKTTLIKAILGLIPVDSGEILLFSMAPGPSERYEIGYVPQIHAFDFQFPITVREMVLTGREKRSKAPFYRYNEEDYRATEAALGRIGILSLADRPVSDLSGGERQRALIARALVGNPKILILDEPTVYVDTPTEEQFFQILSHLSEEITILMITHDIGVVSRHVTQVACLNRRLFTHETSQVTPDMISKTYGCPVDLITHGDIPHRVLDRHGDHHD